MLEKEESSTFLRWGIQVAKVALTAVILTLLVGLFILIGVPIYFYRLLIFLLSRTLRPDLVRMLTPQSSIMATDAIYAKPNCAFVTKFLLDGEISPSQIESRLQNAITNEKFSVLTQSLEKWMGFYFWKRSDAQAEFSLKNQVTLSQDQVTLEEIRQLHTTLVDKPFKKGQPLWECILYNNVTPEKSTRIGAKQSVIFFRVHQALADGTSWFGIFDELKMVPEYQSMLNLFMGNTKPAMSLKDKIKLALRISTLGPYNMVRDWVERITERKLAKERMAEVGLRERLLRTNNNHKGKKETEFVIEEMYLDNARRIAMANLAPAGALSLSLVAGVLRRIAQENESGLVPKSFKINCPLPIPIPNEGNISNYV